MGQYCNGSTPYSLYIMKEDHDASSPGSCCSYNTTPSQVLLGQTPSTQLVTHQQQCGADFQDRYLEFHDLVSTINPHCKHKTSPVT